MKNKAIQVRKGSPVSLIAGIVEKKSIIVLDETRR